MTGELAAILQTMLDAVVAVDETGRIVGWNAVAAEVFGWSAGEAVGRPLGDLIVPAQHRAAHQSGMARFNRTGVATVLNRRIEIEAVDRAGRLFPVELSIVEASAGSDARFIGFIRDISDRRDARDRLALSEESLRLATDAAEVGTWDLDLAADVLTWSDRTRAMFGISAGVPCSLADFYGGLHPDDREITSAAFAAALDPARRATYDVEYRTIGREDGLVRWVGAKGRGLFDADGTCVRAVGTAIDITERKRQDAHNAFMLELADMLRGRETIAVLHGASRLMGEHFGVSRVGYGRLDEAGDLFDYDICWTDGTIPPLLGRYPAQAFGTKIVASLAAGETVVVDDLLQAAISDEAETRATAREVDTRSILVVPFVWAGQLRAIVYLNGRDPRAWTPDEVRFMEAVAERTREVIARAEVEAALRQLNEDLEARVRERTDERNILARVFEETDAYVHVVDCDYRWLAINRAGADEFERVFGTRPKVGDRMLDLIADQPAELEAVQAVWSRALGGEEFTSISEFGDPRIVQERRSYEMKFNTLRDAEGRQIGAFQLVNDVTERIRAAAQLETAQDQLRQAQKMEAVGQLTGGVAHDFNNLLTVIRGSVELLNRPGISEQGRQRHLAAIAETADRATRLTGQLLAFARRQTLKPELFDVAQALRSIAVMVTTLAGSRIVLELDLPAEPCFALADPGQFDTAIVNMAINARDAMPATGTLTISVTTASAIPPGAGQAEASGDFVAVSIADTGSGIAPEDLERIFEPFFTTKSVGHGTGLGLSQVIGFAKQSGGDVRVESMPRAGATFTLYLPRALGRKRKETGEAFAAVTDAAASLCVLVVEDNQQVGEFVTHALQELGHHTVLAKDGAGALELLNQPGTHFEIVFSDVMMPGMSGVELAAEIRRRHPALPIILTSGYSDVLARSAEHREFQLLRKPYSIDELDGALNAAVRNATPVRAR